MGLVWASALAVLVACAAIALRAALRHGMHDAGVSGGAL